MVKYLVTGGAGFIGCNLANRLLDEGNEVVVFDNLSRIGTEKNIDWLKREHGEGLKFLEKDINDYKALLGVMDGIDVVYHTAAQVAVTTSVENPRKDFEINALGTLNVLEAVRNSKADPVLVFTSTNKVYGNMEEVEVVERGGRYDYNGLNAGVSEEQPLDFHSPYGCSKGAADQYVRDYSRIYGMKNVVFRMSCIYGPRQFGNVDQGWVAHFTISSILGKPITIYGDGKQVRDILYVDDLVNAFILATGKINKTRGQVYNMGGGPENVISLVELMGHLEKLSGKKMRYNYREWRPGDQKVYYSNTKKAGRDFGWKPKISKREGVEKLFKWISENRDLFG